MKLRFFVTLAFLLGLNFVSVQSQKEKIEPITLEVTLESAVEFTDLRIVHVAWKLTKHPDNKKHSFVMSGVNGDYKFLEGTLNGKNDPESFPICIERHESPCSLMIRPGPYVFEACVYRIKKNKMSRFCSSDAID